MPRLRDIATLVRSKNAGPFLLTIDVIFDCKDNYDLVVASDVLTTETIASMYSVPADQIALFRCVGILAIKVTLPRLVPAGDVLDTDIYGAQQIGPLLEIVIPDELPSRGNTEDR